MTTSTLVAFYLSPAILFVAALARLWALFRNPHDALLRAVCALMVVGSLILVSAAPPTVGLLNEVTGVTNIAAPIVYTIFNAFSGACIVVLVHWRGGEAERISRTTRRLLIAFALVIALLWALFLVGDAPIERRRDFDTFYARTPFIREMIVLYLLTHTLSALTMIVVCWRWSRQVPGWLRFGLATVSAGTVLALCFDVLKYTAVVARWTGHDLDRLSSDLAVGVAALAASLLGVGFLIPPIGQRAAASWRTIRRHRELRPLWQVVRGEITTPGADPLPWWASAELRQLQRERDFHDAILRLAPYLDREVGAAVLERARASRRSEDEAFVEADAAVIAAAVVAKARSGPTLEPEERWTVRSSRSTDDLVRLSRALAGSPLVRAGRARALAGRTTP
ncbi:MAB_1171c family putative transporter (plasmid) [Streptomyces sp. BI20]|uniref:MAB_1171c family putative transporter n=1 Tax=Streptomyces sp. BI20 TaxID=3403460 RepID=UPI003C76F107